MAKKKKPRKHRSRPAPAGRGASRPDQSEPAGPPTSRRAHQLVAAGGFALALALLLLIPAFREIFFGERSPALQERQPFPPPPAVPARPAVQFEDFAGSQVCAECHQHEFAVWKKSTHGRAGGNPDKVKILGKFDGRPRRFRDTTVIPFRTKSRELRFRVKQKGFPEKVFRVEAVVGGGHMAGGGTQTYFAKFPDGTLRFLPFDFIRREQRWFGETKNKRGWVPIGPDLGITELSEWPPSRVLGATSTFNNCQECHGSQINIRFDAVRKKYVTRYKTLAINCESCHGPGRRHVELARAQKRGETDEIGVETLDGFDKDGSLNVCFRCHSLKDVLEPGYLPGKRLDEYYALKFPILGENPYHPDGRVRAFGYQLNHLFSDCYLNGSMTCVDCHDPHSQDYRDIFGRALVGKFDDRQCTDCHPSKARDVPRHTHHKPGSPGSLCTSCHMPFLQHRAMGNVLRFARSDHTIPIPRPAFDAGLGIENACSQCHKKTPVDSLQQTVRRWYGALKPHKPIVQALQRAEAGKITAAELVSLIDADDAFRINQFALISWLLEHELRPDRLPAEAGLLERLQAMAHSEDLDLRAIALAALHLTADQRTEIHNFLVQRLQDAGADAPALRRRWAVALAFLGSRYRERGEAVAAVSTLTNALEIWQGDDEILQNLGLAYRDAGDLQRAMSCFQQAAQANPADAMIFVNLGLIYTQLGNAQAAHDSYAAAARINPYLALAPFNLGNSEYRQKHFDRAAAYYARAVELDPSLAQGYFNLAKSYIQTQALAAAKEAVVQGLQFDPENRTGAAMLRDLNAYLGGKKSGK